MRVSAGGADVGEIAENLVFLFNARVEHTSILKREQTTFYCVLASRKTNESGRVYNVYAAPANGGYTRFFFSMAKCVLVLLF